METMKVETKANEAWRGLAVSLVGQGHVRSELPCQDASGCLTGSRPAAIVCDGAGSVARSEEGAKAAVAAFKRGLGLFEPWIAQCLDGPQMPDEVADCFWRYICEWMARALEESKLELVRDRGGCEKDYDYTVAFAVVGQERCGFFQVGDGMIVAGSGDHLKVVFAPEKGRFANETRFLRVGTGIGRQFQAALLPRTQVDRVAVTSDGPVKLLFDARSLTPSALFGKMFEDLAGGTLSRGDLCSFLTCRKWAEIGAEDDKTLVLLTLETTAVAVA